MKYLKTIDQLNEAKTSPEESQLERIIRKFDSKYHEFRYKIYDIYESYDEEDVWFVDYITQQDYDNKGESILAGALREVSDRYGVDVYLRYESYDPDLYKKSNRDRKTKKDYKIV